MVLSGWLTCAGQVPLKHVEASWQVVAEAQTVEVEMEQVCGQQRVEPEEGVLQ